MKRRQSFFIIICVLLSFLIVGKEEYRVEAFSDQIIQQGAVGEDVIELQARLQYLGFYNGKIDGVFGWGTYWALRNFQYEFGMEVDGLAGTTTKNKLEKASEYDEANVKKQINSGKSFTHYGGNNKQEGNEQDNTTDDQKDTTGGNTAVNVPQGYSQNDIDLMANAVHGEARGEPYEGQVAVAAVILNRVKSPTFPNTTAGVIFEPRAFTAVR